MNKPFLWSDNVTPEAYDRQFNDNPEYVIKKLHDDITKLKEQNQNYSERIKSALNGPLLDEVGNRGEGGFYNHPDYELIKKLLEVGYE